jgi:hypothetical protein
MQCNAIHPFHWNEPTPRKEEEEEEGQRENRIISFQTSDSGSHVFLFPDVPTSEKGNWEERRVIFVFLF